MAKLEWRIVSPEEHEEEERNRCRARRGPRGTVECEIDRRKHPAFHAGRGVRGQWFTWSLKGGEEHVRDAGGSAPSEP